MSVDSKIAEYILRAQNASDGGKGIDALVASRKSRRDNCAGYSVKDKYILCAMKLIISGDTAFKFAVTPDKEGIANYIVYFETKIGYEKLQVSFHTYRNFSRYVNNSFRMKWDHASSRDSAQRMYDYYIPDGMYCYTE